jgi:ABC-type Zn uptake system ZnuABC Zn-binding protein ZnuA/ABC-type Mn2+/Zn2+ transport system permease subunit
MVDVFTLPFVQRGLVEILLLAVAAGLVGTWIVLRGLAFFAHAVGTAAFPGLVLADGLGFSASLGALGAALLFALLLGAGRREEGADVRTGLVLVGALAAGVLLASDVFRSGSNVESLLFGSLLLVGWSDVVIAAAVAAVAVLATAVLGRRWVAAGFDPGQATRLGVPPRTLDAALLVLVAITAVAALSVAGALLATALLVVPAATTRLLAPDLRRWQLTTIALAAAEGTAGLWLSVQTDAPPGATIAVIAGVVFALAALARASRARAIAAAAAVAVLAGAALVVAGCGSGTDDGRLDVVATTTQIGDFARAVGGADVDVHQILQPNTDAHDYEPRPSDVRKTAGAKVVLANGQNLDHWIGEVVDQSGGDPTVVDLSANLPDRVAGETAGPEASTYDPHWFHDPVNAQRAVLDIRDAFAKADPANTAAYDANAEAYLAKLRALDAEIRGCIDAVPPADRKLVTDHDAFNYFAKRYGLTVVGAVIPSQTTQAQPSAGDLADLAALVKREDVKAIFPEASLPAKTAESLARQTGAAASYHLYGDALGPKGSSGATYLSMERANADAIVRGLTAGAEGCP